MKPRFHRAVVIAIALSFIGFAYNSYAASTANISLEPETGTLSSAGVTIKSDAAASGGSYIEFASPMVTPTPDPSFQPTAPYYATFFYLWYQNPATDSTWSYWSDQGTPPQTWFSHYLPDPIPATFDPSRELYSSHNYDTFKWQASKLAEARQEVAIASWWGQARKEDTALTKILTDFMTRSDNPYPNLRWAIYYEQEGFGNPTVTQLVSDLTHIKNTFTTTPYFLKTNGKPVVFVYADATDGSTMAQRWHDANVQLNNSFYIVLKVYPGYAADPNQPNSWHQYAPAVREDSQGTYSYSVSPGFWLDGDAVRLPRNLPAFQSAVSRMVASNATWKLVETWNEWGEGTSVEPGQQVILGTGRDIVDPNGSPFENVYVDTLARLLPPLETGNISTTPTPTSPPNTPTPSPSNQAIVIAAVGDMVHGKANTCSTSANATNCREKSVSDLILSINPSYFLALGDVQYEMGEIDDFNTYYTPTYGRFLNKTLPVIGNHEYLDPTGASNPSLVSYFDYYGRNGTTTKAPGPPTQGYYVTKLDNWSIYALNSNCSKVSGGCSANSPQVTWLKNELAVDTNPCQILMMHHPIISSDSRGFDTSAVAPIWTAFYDRGGDIALVGHSHFYERYKPLNASLQVDTIRGIRQFIVGTGGKNIYPPADPTSTCTFKGVAVECTSETWAEAFGVLKLTLHQAGYDWEYVQIPTDPHQPYSDSGTDICH